MARIASNNPELMLGGGGLADDFDGRITESRGTVVRSKTSKIDSIAVRWKIEPTDEYKVKLGKDEVISYAFAGRVSSFIPCNGTLDEPVPVDLGSDELDGIFFGAASDFEDAVEWIKGQGWEVESYDDLWGGSDWKLVLRVAGDAGLRDIFSPDLRFPEGGVYHFNRKKRPTSGVRTAPPVVEGQQPKEDLGVLCITQVVEKPGKAGAKKAAAGDGAAAKKTTTTAAAKAPAKAASTTAAASKANGAGAVDEEAFDELLTNNIVEILAEAEGNELDIKSMTQQVMDRYTPTEKAKAMKRMKDAQYQAAAVGFTYNEGTRIFTLG